MANRIAKFEKVSPEMYSRLNWLFDDTFKAMETYDKPIDPADVWWETSFKYEDIILPKRSTKSSAGYDIHTPMPIYLNPGESIVIPTYLRCKIEDDWALFLFPKSGLGFKYNVTLANTVGIVDADYYNTQNGESSNEGHIMVKLKNLGDERMEIAAGAKFCQGVFLQYGITEDDEADGVRNGGFGSTGA